MSRVLRVLATCDWFSPGTGGGAERVAFEVVRRLAGPERSFTVLATQPPDAAQFALPADVRVVSAPARSLAGILRAQVSVAPGLPRLVAKTIREVQPDVIWAHSLQFQTTHLAALVARRAGIPLVVTAHIGDLSALGGAVGLAARAHEATIGRLILRSARRAIAVSDPVAEHLAAIAPGLPVDTVPNGVDLDRFAPDRRPHDGFRVGFLGRLVANKGPELAILAVAGLVARGINASLAFVGDGPERARLAELAVGQGIAERVTFEGYRPDPERWLGCVDALVRPSLTEGMPLGVLEAMAAGVPVVASDIPGNTSLIHDRSNGLLVPPRDVLALAAALESLASDPGFGRRIASRGIATAALMSWTRTAELTDAVLTRALTRPEESSRPWFA